jgi:hypothetical protein
MTLVRIVGSLALGSCLLFTPGQTTAPPASQARAETPAAHLMGHAQAPADYVLSKLRDHRVVILGEAHRLRHDVQLVLDVVPRLVGAGADTLAMEVYPGARSLTFSLSLPGGVTALHVRMRRRMTGSLGTAQ